MKHRLLYMKCMRTVSQLSLVCLTLVSNILAPLSSIAVPSRNPDKTVNCDILVAGGGLSGAATAYEGLLLGKTVCLTEVTDWLGGQISSQGTSALDERPTQRAKQFYSRGYLDLRNRIQKRYKGNLNPGDCWVSDACFLPKDGHELLTSMLKDAAARGRGKLEWFPNTVVKELEKSADGKIIDSVYAIQHQPVKGAPPINTLPLSQTIEDAYKYENSANFTKTIIRFNPKQTKIANNAPKWYVVDTTETGELIGLADVPYRLGIDPLSYLEPSSSSTTNDQYCTQGFTYTFAMEATTDAQPQIKPTFYDQYSPYFSYELKRLADFDLVFTYRRIWSPQKGKEKTFGGVKFTVPTPNDISMQNWTWGNDYRPGTAQDNLYPSAVASDWTT